jgi:hypothetical protein
MTTLATARDVIVAGVAALVFERIADLARFAVAGRFAVDAFAVDTDPILSLTEREANWANGVAADTGFTAGRGVTRLAA